MSGAAGRALSGRRAVVLGLGCFGGGLGAARWLARHGARVLVTDRRSADELAESLAGLAGLDVETVLGEHRTADFERAELVVANPAVPPDHPLLALARASGARVTSEIELLLEAIGSLGARVVAVTGTQGKSSTCHLLTRLLEGAGRRVHVGGNIGGSLLDALDEIQPEDLVVLELSSYQLEALPAPDAGVRVEAVAVTNVLADHLERHRSRAAYAAAKRRILDLVGPEGVALLPADDEVTREWVPARGRRLAFSTTGEAPLTIEDGTFVLDGEVLAPLEALRLPGAFQRANALVALGLARLLGEEPATLARALPGVEGLEHRLEPLGLFRGRRVHDNAVSTTPDSTVAALRSMPRGTCLVVGGRLKSLPLEELAAVARERAGAAICFGEAREPLAEALRSAGVRTEEAESLETAVALALDRAPPGGDVLFSPACSSFDAFANFRERARAFRAALPERDA